jgi:hypothetical protein
MAVRNLPATKIFAIDCRDARYVPLARAAGFPEARLLGRMVGSLTILPKLRKPVARKAAAKKR